ncbi:MAG: hypothetical protein WC238_00030 [Parcubacteria group bacterium]|jgi:hypothetical protein
MSAEREMAAESDINKQKILEGKVAKEYEKETGRKPGAYVPEAE